MMINYYRKMDPQNGNQNQQQKGCQKRRGTVQPQQSEGPPPHFYHPEMRILTIGDGDLSFSMSIAQWIHYKTGSNFRKFLATTYDSLQSLNQLYKANLPPILDKLKKHDVQVLHEIDATKLPQLKNLIDQQKQGYDRIVWNFPHSGFPEKNYGPGFEWEEDFNQKHTEPIKCFFLHAREYLREAGLVLMAHKTVKPFGDWNIPHIAQSAGFKLVETFPFNIDCYPGYENRRGAGKNGGKRFPIQDAIQYSFSPL